MPKAGCTFTDSDGWAVNGQLSEISRRDHGLRPLDGGDLWSCDLKIIGNSQS